MNLNQVILKCGAILVACVSVAATAGYLAGRTENVSVIGAAVVTGLLALVLGWCMTTSKNEKIAHSIFSSLNAVVFCGVFLLVMNFQIDRVANINQKVFVEELRIRETLHQRYLERCSETEFQINYDRAQVGLPPLSSEIVCSRPFQ